MSTRPDIRIENHGSVTRVVPVSVAGRTWIDENVESEDWQWLGSALCVDSRFAHDLAVGAEGDGLRVTLH